MYASLQSVKLALWVTRRFHGYNRALCLTDVTAVLVTGGLYMYHSCVTKQQLIWMCANSFPQCYLTIISTVKPTRCTNVSNSFYCGMTIYMFRTVFQVHHQQFKTVHSATGICQTDTAVCLLAIRQQYLFDTSVRLVGRHCRNNSTVATVWTSNLLVEWR